ncbi:hypothetical protein [Nitrobacter winogradskyi]|uniref:hypothetical protein n=1 Tax=Nitrobacter winogradskyi TaxID=913 RepID=UPI0002E8DEBC|nr:hypothetical protein [Nitrobacter winogradskyi]
MAYALFYQNQCIGAAAPTELEAWRRALRSGLITNIPASDYRDVDASRRGLYVKQVNEEVELQFDGKFPTDAS